MPLIGRWFYVAMAVTTIAAVAVGFGRTYAAPMARGAFQGPTTLHVVMPYVWVIVAMLRDRVERHAVHPVLAYAGSAVILEQSLEALAFDSPPWRAAAQFLYGWFHT